MHPAPSVILFTALSGLGFGLMAWLGIGMPAVDGWVAFVFFALAFALAGGGLLASTFHLGNPKNALKAFTQWKTSWLSREAWLSVLTLGVVGIYAIGIIFLGETWTVLGWVGSVLALVTVYSTSMIYAQLKTVPRWNSPTTSVLFLGYAIAGGALLAGQATVAGIMLAILGAVQFVVWQMADGRFAAAGHTMETATGLGNLGKVRLFEAPHSGSNYLLHEMVYVVGRKHALKLRMLSLVLGFAVPAVVLLAFPASHMLALVAVISHAAGLFAARWLFFAEAEHVVGLYYGKR